MTDKVQLIKTEAEIFRRLLDGRPKAEVYEYVRSLGMQGDWVYTVVNKIVDEIHALNAIDAADVVRMNVDRYEDLYRRCMEQGVNKLAMACLHAKEKLLGLHDVDQSIEVYNNKFFINKSMFNLEGLTEEEQKRLDHLMDKTDFNAKIKTIPISNES